MKKVVLLVLLMCTCLTGCDWFSTTDTDITSLFVEVSDVPDDFSVSKNDTYYYNVDTGVVYVGNKRQYSNAAYYVRLESEDFDKYIYDKETSSFIGVE